MSQDFGSYRLLERIGGGGLGEVFRAQIDSGKPVALKRLAGQHLRSMELAAILIREGEIAKSMRHERLLGALDCGMVGDWPYLTQRLAREGTLAARLKPALATEELSAFAIDLFEAVSAVHANGYAHCDLSPGNLLFDEGRALLADFSATTALGKRQAQPQGTYAFMSPEQVKGELIDARSDIFSLATLLWLCVSGERIFMRSASHLSLMAVVEDEPAALPDAMRAIEDALRPALAKKPTQRPGDIAELRDAFLAALANSES